MIEDAGDMVVYRDPETEEPVGVFEYRADADTQTVMTGPLLAMPHADSFEVAAAMVMFVRDKYPREDGWTMTTDSGACAARPVWETWIEHGKTVGLDPFDQVGNIFTPGTSPSQDWQLNDEVFSLDWTNQEFPPTQQIRAIFADLFGSD